MTTTVVIELFVLAPALIALGVKLGIVIERNWWVTASMGMAVVVPDGRVFYVLTPERIDALRADRNKDVLPVPPGEAARRVLDK